MAELVARAKMLFRRPAREVFNAFVQPDLITKFWLKSTTGPLGQGAQVEWQFMVPGATERVNVWHEPSSDRREKAGALMQSRALVHAAPVTGFWVSSIFPGGPRRRARPSPRCRRRTRDRP